MAIKNLVMDEYSDDSGYRNMTLLSGSVNDEVICAEFHCSNDPEDSDIIEMAINLEDMIKMRDFLNTIISKVEKNREEVN